MSATGVVVLRLSVLLVLLPRATPSAAGAAAEDMKRRAAPRSPRRQRSRSPEERGRRKRLSDNSMSSQRLDEIIQQLMKPISNLRQNFDTNLSSLLEEYLTEAGLHHLDNRTIVDDDEAIQPDFARIALLLQQSANIYSKKVDFFEQSVLDMITHFEVNVPTSNEEEQGPEEQTHTSGRRKRKHPDAIPDFCPIDLEPAPNIDREVGHIKPPPTLPKTYIEFEPRIITDKDAKLTDYRGEVIGVVSDFHVNWNLKEGLLVDDLDSSAAMSKDMVCPIDLAILSELRRTPRQSSRPGSDSGIECLPETPDDVPHDSQVLDTPIAIAAEVQENTKPKRTKKEYEGKPDKLKNKELPKFGLSESMNERILAIQQEFELLKEVVEPEIKRRKLRLLKFRFKISCHKGYLEFMQGSPRYSDFRGFPPEELDSTSRRCKELECRLSLTADRLSDHEDLHDDGFHEQSHEDCRDHNMNMTSESYGQAAYLDGDELAARVDAWHSHIAPRIAAAEKHADFQVHKYSAQIISQLPLDSPKPFTQLVRGAQHHDLSRYFLATLFLANTGNVDIRQTGAPLSVDSFDVQLLTRDSSLYASANPFN